MKQSSDMSNKRFITRMMLTYFASPVSIPVLFGKPLFETVAGMFAEDPPAAADVGSEASGLVAKGFVVPLFEPPTGFPLPPPMT